MQPLRIVVACSMLAAAAGLVSACGGGPTDVPNVAAASPQRVQLDWSERYPETGPALVFEVRSFEVRKNGWRAEVAIHNETDARWEVPALDSGDRAFGVLLLPTGDLAELQRRSERGNLFATREARTFSPPLPASLAGGDTWRGSMGGPGALPAGLWVRLVFGPLIAVGTPPPGTEQVVGWFTDHAYRLRL